MRTTTRQNKSGPVTYIQLATNQWDPAKRRSVPTIIATLGRTDRDGGAQLEALAQSCLRYLGKGQDGSDPAGVSEPTRSRPLGGAWLLDGLWRQLGLGKAVAGAAQAGRGRPRDMDRLERVLFGMVCDRALAPSSKLAGAEWMTEDVAIAGLAARVDEDECYRAMDWLTAAGDAFERQVYDSTADLLNLDCDLLFFDTTSTYWETPCADEPEPRDAAGRVCDPCDEAGRVGFRTWGKSKDSRDDLPQIVIGMAVTRNGIPVRVWCWPGNTPDQGLIRQARAELRDWNLSRVVYVADRGFTSEKNRRDLMGGTDGYILGEKLRCGSEDSKNALSRPGRYRVVADNMQVKEVNAGTPDRMIVCFNPDEAVRDKATRERLVARLTDMIGGSDDLTDTKRAELRGKISTMPGLNRFLRVTPTGLLRVDQAKTAEEANLDGKYLLRTSNPALSTEDVALGYKQLLQVERGWRDMKSTLDLRPVYHHLERRIRAHVTLCWLALLLIRVAETRAGDTWNHIRTQMQRLCQIDYDTPQGTVSTHTKVTPAQADILAKLNLPAPPAAAVTPAVSA